MTPSDFAPELRVLLYAARPSISADESEKLDALLDGKLEWTRWLELCRYHRVVPIVTRNLNPHWNKVPEEVGRKLKNGAARTLRANLLWWKHLIAITDALSARRIRAVPFKGPVLSFILYGDMGRRQFRDLDVLVSPHDARNAFEALRELGYASEETLTELRSRNQLLFRRPDGVVVELHWRLSHTPGAFPRELGAPEGWRELRIANRDLGALPMEELFLFLCHHGSFHVWERLSWLTDIRAFVSLENPCEWERVEELAKRSRMERELNLTLSLASSLLGATPPQALRRFAESRVRAGVRKEVVSILGRTAPTPLHSGRKSWGRKWRTLIYQFRLKPTLQFRWQAVVMALSKATRLRMRMRMRRRMRTGRDTLQSP